MYRSIRCFLLKHIAYYMIIISICINLKCYPLLSVHNISSPEFLIVANQTYTKVIPCLERAWMLKGYKHKIQWKFPEDAHEHYIELLKATKPYRRIQVHEYAGYEGPWLENLFISKFIDIPLHKFHGFIPIFIQWIDSQILRGRLFDNILNTLSTLIRPNVIYLAISQGDVGLGKIGKAFPNILVLSAGGYGHIALPLIKGELEYIPPPDNYTQDIGFFGNPHTPPRPLILSEIQRLSEEFNLRFKQSQGSSWKQDMANSKFNLAPRGYGRNSFRLTESIQLGRIPILLYDDLPWIPFTRTNLSIDTFGFMARHFDRHNTIPLLIKTIHNLSTTTYQERYAHMLAIRHHYTYKGVLKQILLFIANPFDSIGMNRSQLTCIYHPHNERCCG